MGVVSLGEKRDYYLIYYRVLEEEFEYGEEVRSYLVVQVFEDLEGGRYGSRGSKGYRVLRFFSEESQEEEDKRSRFSLEFDNMVRRYSEESEEQGGYEEGRYYRVRGR